MRQLAARVFTQETGDIQDIASHDHLKTVGAEVQAIGRLLLGPVKGS